MPERIENRMLRDSEFEALEKDMTEEVKEKLNGKGFHEVGIGTFVPESEAYEYALERCLNGTEEDIKEFKEMLVEWFYSGGDWRKEE